MRYSTDLGFNSSLSRTQTCFIIALKARESIEVEPTFVSEWICEDMYCPEEFVEMEIEILRALGWRLNGPTPCDFIQYFVELLPPTADKQAVNMLVKKAVKNSEDVMVDYSVALEPSSCIALASIEALNMTEVSSAFYGQLDITGWMALLARVMNDPKPHRFE